MLDDKPLLRITVAIATKHKIVLESPIVLLALVLLGCYPSYAKSGLFAPGITCVRCRKGIICFRVEHAAQQTAEADIHDQNLFGEGLEQFLLGAAFALLCQVVDGRSPRIAAVG